MWKAKIKSSVRLEDVFNIFAPIWLETCVSLKFYCPPRFSSVLFVHWKQSHFQRCLSTMPHLHPSKKEKKSMRKI